MKNNKNVNKGEKKMKNTLNAKKEKIENFLNWLADPLYKRKQEDIRHQLEKMMLDKSRDLKIGDSVKILYGSYKGQIGEVFDFSINQITVKVAGVERYLGREDIEIKNNPVEKIDPDTDTLESALIKKGISPKVTKAILFGYEGIILHKPISISLYSKESFYGRDLLIKTIMIFEHKYNAWNNDLFSINNNYNKKQIQSLLDDANEAKAQE